jgi:hypothetical protein
VASRSPSTGRVGEKFDGGGERAQSRRRIGCARSAALRDAGCGAGRSDGSHGRRESHVVPPVVRALPVPAHGPATHGPRPCPVGGGTSSVDATSYRTTGPGECTTTSPSGGGTSRPGSGQAPAGRGVTGADMLAGAADPLHGCQRATPLGSRLIGWCRERGPGPPHVHVVRGPPPCETQASARQHRAGPTGWQPQQRSGSSRRDSFAGRSVETVNTELGAGGSTVCGERPFHWPNSPGSGFCRTGREKRARVSRAVRAPSAPRGATIPTCSCVFLVEERLF